MAADRSECSLKVTAYQYGIVPCRDAIYRVLFGYGVFRRRDKSRLYNAPAPYVKAIMLYTTACMVGSYL